MQGENLYTYTNVANAKVNLDLVCKFHVAV